MIYDLMTGFLKGTMLSLMILAYIGIKKIFKALHWKIKGIPLVATFCGIKDWELVRDGGKIKQKIIIYNVIVNYEGEDVLCEFKEHLNHDGDGHFSKGSRHEVLYIPGKDEVVLRYPSKNNKRAKKPDAGKSKTSRILLEEASAKQKTNTVTTSSQPQNSYIYLAVPNIPDEKIRFCRNCGKELPEGSRFCNICGTEIYPTNEKN